MTEPKAMLFEVDVDQGIRCMLISDRCKVYSYVTNQIELLLEIKKNKPVIVFIDSDVYAIIDGIKTAQTIRYKYGIPVMYF